nr:SDR family NAD(P)-dependent oxidoreductase [Pseudomonadota bacterium]
MSLTGKIALVTGASRGIGKAIALELARQGAIVTGTATTDAGAASITDYLKSEGLLGEGMHLNVTEPATIDATLSAIQSQYGDVQI